MVEETEWTVVFYTDDDGKSPVREFLNGLDAKTKARFVWSIRRLRELNIKARAPLVKPLEGKLWELREESQTNIYRLVYFFHSGRQIVFLHGFQKKSNKTPRQDIEIAKARMTRFIE